LGRAVRSSGDGGKGLRALANLLTAAAVDPIRRRVTVHEGYDAMTTLASEDLSDHGLLALVARGDHEAFARLYDGYGAAAYALAARIVRDRDLAADVVQDAFLTIWNQASRFDAARGEPSTWILTLTHHKAVDVVRRESRRRVAAIDETYDAVDTAARVDAQAEQSVARAEVRAALSRLTDPHRELLELAYFAGYTQSELAERLAVPVGTIKSRTHTAMTALREHMVALGMRPEQEWNASPS
jgi:RNA polymerase sigma-70 factor, ECF subfamily